MKKIIAAAVLLVLFIFSLACLCEDSTLMRGCGDPGIGLEERLEKRTGQTFDGWTYSEMKALEEELNRLEEEKKMAWKQAQEDKKTVEESQDTGQESTQSQQSQPFESDEGYDYDTEEEQLPEMQELDSILEGQWRGVLIGQEGGGDDSLSLSVEEELAIYGKKISDPAILDFYVAAEPDGMASVQILNTTAYPSYYDNIFELKVTTNLIKKGDFFFESDSIKAEYIFSGIVEKDGGLLIINGNYSMITSQYQEKGIWEAEK